VFRGATALCALSLLGAGILIGAQLLRGALPVLSLEGVKFLYDTTWDPNSDVFGALPFLAGTAMTSAVAMLIAGPMGLAIAVLLAEYAPIRLRSTLSLLVELLAAVPSVVYGLWGIFVLAPLMQQVINPLIEKSPLGSLPLFGTPTLGLNYLSASVLLAIMALPIVASLSREVLLAVPTSQREAALALGLTRWETIRHVVIPWGRAGLLGALLLGLGRALGETMAVTMVIGNQVSLTPDLFQAGYTLSAGIANQFAEAVTPLHTSALMGLALVLCTLSLCVNIVARVFVGRVRHRGAE
jgi:phosphate transport system permease protein